MVFSQTQEYNCEWVCVTTHVSGRELSQAVFEVIIVHIRDSLTVSLHLPIVHQD